MELTFIKSEERLPKASDINGECAQYYAIFVEGYGLQKAMRLEENGISGWYDSYLSQIIRPVIGWIEIKE